MTFTTRKEIYSPITLNREFLKLKMFKIKYLGLYLSWSKLEKKHISTKRKQLGFQLGKMYRLLGE